MFYEGGCKNEIGDLKWIPEEESEGNVMGFKRMVTTVDAHVEGAPARVVTGGIPNIPGKTMVEKLEFMQRNLDHLRTSLVNEPRGHKDMLSAVLTPPVTDEAAFGVVFMSPRRFLPMCGHGAMGVASVAVEMGIIEAREPVTEFVIDTASGPIHPRVNVKNGKATSVTIQNVPAFLYKTALIKLPNLGELPVDISYGGNFFIFIDAKHLGITVDADNIKRSESLFAQIVKSTNEQVVIQHPEIDSISGAMIVIINDRPVNPKANIRNILVSGSGTNQHIDRSPCGTATCAKMATLFAKGELSLGETFVTESLLGSLFYGKLVNEVSVGDIRAVVPEVTGRSFITGIHNFTMDEDDPFKYGFVL